MPDMWEVNEKVIAIFLSDIHLSLNPPVWRSAEPDWMKAQARPLIEIQKLQKEENCPILCAGDINDRNKGIADGWNVPPELINWAMKHLPGQHPEYSRFYGIPGQHDTPNHRYEDIYRSAFQTLVNAKKIEELEPEQETIISLYDNLIQDKFDDIRVFGFPFGFPIKPCPYTEGEKFCIAVVHDYIWIPGHSYPDAPEERSLRKLHRNPEGGKFYGYNVVVYGDNHKGFTTHAGKTTIFNCGTLMRRKSDEIDYKPQVGLLLESGEVISHYLDISKDKYLETMENEIEPEELDMTSFIKELEKLGDTVLDFKERVEQLFLHTKKISIQAKQIIINAMEK